MFRVSRKLGVHMYNSHPWCWLLGCRLEKCCDLSWWRNQDLLHNLQHLVNLYPQGKRTRSASSQQGTGSSNLCFIEQIWLIGVCCTSTAKWIKKNLTGVMVDSSKQTSSLSTLTTALQRQSRLVCCIDTKNSTARDCAVHPHFYSLQENSHIVFQKHFQFQMKTAKLLYDWTLLLPEVVPCNRLQTLPN